MSSSSSTSTVVFTADLLDELNECKNQRSAMWLLSLAWKEKENEKLFADLKKCETPSDAILLMRRRVGVNEDEVRSEEDFAPDAGYMPEWVTDPAFYCPSPGSSDDEEDFEMSCSSEDEDEDEDENKEKEKEKPVSRRRITKFGDLSFFDPFVNVSAIQLANTLVEKHGVDADDLYPLLQRFAPDESDCLCTPGDRIDGGLCAGPHGENWTIYDCYASSKCTSCHGTRLCHNCGGWGNKDDWNSPNY